MQITHRPLTRAEAVRLHQELKTTPNILGYTVRELERLTDVQVAEQAAGQAAGQATEGDGDGFAGVCFSVDLAAGWTEIAALYVLPEFRGRGLGADLFRAAWERAQGRGRHVYVLSRNPQVVGWMRELGMAVDGKLWRAPFAVHWYMQCYMASRHRFAESIRKGGAIRKCPPLLQGIKRHEGAEGRDGAEKQVGAG